MDKVVHAVRSAMASMMRARVFRAAGPVLLPPTERVVKWLSRGRWQLSSLVVPSLALYSTGARSGETRETYLMYTPDGQGGAIVAGTAFGQSRHPAWTYNLLAHPEASVRVHGRRIPVRASLVEDDERDAVWALLQSQLPGYRSYERESGRVVRLFRLRPLTRTTIP